MRLSLLGLCLALPLFAQEQGVQTVITGSQSQQSKRLTLEQQSVVASVEIMFKSIGADDVKCFKSVTTSGFYLFDAGSRFDGTSILGMVQQLKAAGTTFDWNVTEPDVHIDGNSAWIAYVDRGSMIEPSCSRSMEWLESVFLIKDASTWKLAFMQSTPVASTSVNP
jgi:hypothetical protein